jgi:hypothetical protein
MNRQLAELAVGPASIVYNKLTKEEKKERYSNNSSSDGKMILGQIVSLIIGVVAIYLSWNCNTVKGENTGLKVVYAFFAFLFAPIYILIHVLMIRPCVSR